jgi:hypothetical protein
MKQHDYKTGDIIHHSWGYDQTNADFYQVVKVSEKSIWIAQIESTETCDSNLCGKAQPIPNKFSKWSVHDTNGGRPKRKTPYFYEGCNNDPKWLVRINDYTAGAERWNGQLISVTHYA